MKAIVLVLILALSGSRALRADEVDDYVEAQRQRFNVPGISLAVVKSGKVIKAKGYGIANIELNVPATPTSAYQLASVTKQFTATGIMLLVEDGKLKLSDNISKHLDNLPAAWSNITVRHLLTMTSGIKDYLNNMPRGTSRNEFTFEQLIDFVRDKPLDFAPGEAYRYSNSNYILLARIIQQLSDKPYESFLADRIFRPLGMTSTRRDSPTDLITNRAGLYEFRSNKLENVRYLSPSLWNNGDGGLLSTVMDLAAWDAALYTERVLKKSSLEQMWQPAKLNNGQETEYGFGWVLGQQRGHRTVGHAGGRPGTATQITRFLDDELTVIVLLNGRGSAQAIATGVAGRYIPGLLLSSLKPERDLDPALTGRLKQCLLELAEKQDSPSITPEFRSQYALSRSRAESLAARLKDMESFTFVTEDIASGQKRLGVPVSRFRYYKMENPKESRFYRFELTGDGKVAYYQSFEE
jgi:D-alanyl-D-alanine carboxypeptidase